MIYDNPLFSIIYTQYGSPINSPFGCFCTPLFHIFIRGLSRFPRITGLASEIWAKWQPQLTWRWQSYGSCCDVKKMASLFHGFQGFTHPHIPHIPYPLHPPLVAPYQPWKMLEIPAQELLDRDPNKRPPAASSSDHPWSSGDETTGMLVSWGWN